MKNRDYHHKRAQKTGLQSEWLAYRSMRNKTTSLLRESKRNYYFKQIDENKSDSGKLWKTLKSSLSLNKKGINADCIETNGKILHSKREISQGFAKYFRSAVAKIRASLSYLFFQPQSSPIQVNTSFKFSTISFDFVCNELRNIKKNKSTGLPNMPARMLKDGCHILAKPLTDMMNRSLAEGSIPTEWKHATVTPIFKSGSKTDPSNYRPISVLAVFSKILERAVHRMVYAYLQENKFLSMQQSGFRPLHSTTTCLTDITNSLLSNMDKRQLTGMVFLDLAKAFDTLDHTKMLQKLSNLGFSSSAVQWFNAYLSDRTQSIKVDNVLSDPLPIQYGVPQGSILGPLLFIIYINNISSVVNYCRVQLYADDTLLYVSSPSVNVIESKLSEDLERIITWLNGNYLFLNYEKTKVMLVGTHQRLSKVTNFTIRAMDADDQQITLERVYVFKYLGVILDPALTWNDHIDYVAKKISSRLGLLRRSRKILPRQACVILYNAMILPLFDYCCVIWDSCGKTNQQYLDKLQKRAAGIIEGHRVNQTDLIHTLSWQSLKLRRAYHICLLVHKCLNNMAPEYLLDEFHRSGELHTYNTRNRYLLRPPAARTSKYQSSFRINGVRTWNTLPNNLRNEQNFLTFKRRLKNYLKGL